MASDLRIRNGAIAEIGRNLTAGAGGRVIEAKGMLVLPGVVDPHVHLTPIRTATTANGADDYTSASPGCAAPDGTRVDHLGLSLVSSAQRSRGRGYPHIAPRGITTYKMRGVEDL